MTENKTFFFSIAIGGYTDEVNLNLLRTTFYSLIMGPFKRTTEMKRQSKGLDDIT